MSATTLIQLVGTVEFDFIVAPVVNKLHPCAVKKSGKFWVIRCSVC